MFRVLFPIPTVYEFCLGAGNSGHDPLLSHLFYEKENKIFTEKEREGEASQVRREAAATAGKTAVQMEMGYRCERSR